eukprot:10298822-Alexandrium_andersonii.AAC.1
MAAGSPPHTRGEWDCAPAAAEVWPVCETCRLKPRHQTRLVGFCWRARSGLDQTVVGRVVPAAHRPLRSKPSVSKSHARRD